MKKLLLIVALISFSLLSGKAFAYSDGKLEVRLRAISGDFAVMDTGIITKAISIDVVQQQAITLAASGFTAFTVPGSTKGVLIDIGSTKGLKLKSVTGDDGISLDSNAPILIPISRDSMSIGIQNLYGSAATVRVYFF